MVRSDKNSHKRSPKGGVESVGDNFEAAGFFLSKKTLFSSKFVGFSLKSLNIIIMWLQNYHQSIQN